MILTILTHLAAATLGAGAVRFAVVKGWYLAHASEIAAVSKVIPHTVAELRAATSKTIAPIPGTKASIESAIAAKLKK